MSRFGKLIQGILSGRHDNSIKFSESVNLLKALGFSVRIKGSHHIFHREDVEEIINLQPDGSKTKAYQVKQIRELIVKYRMEEKDNE